MRSKTIQEVKFRRRREGVTNYKKRLALVKSGMERVVIRKTNKRILGQIIAYDAKGDKVVASANSEELTKKFNWPSRSNRSTAYLTGLLLAKKAKAKGEVILDTGLTRPVTASIPFVFAKGCMDGGLKLKANLEIKEELYNASQTAKYAEMLRGKQEQYKKQFSAYTSKGVSPESLPKLFNEVKAKILQGS